MSVTRQTVLEQLAKQSDAGTEEMTSVSSIVAALNCDEQTARGHLEHLDACELARLYSDGRVRVTITGEELLELDTGEGIIIDPETNGTRT